MPEVLPRQADPQPTGRQEAHVLPRLRLIGPKRPQVAFAAAVLSGVLLFLANPPADLGPLAFVALIPLLWALGEARPRRGAAIGFVFGLTYFALLLRWLKPFGIIAWLPLVADQAAFAALFGAVTAVLLRRARERPTWAWAAALGAAGAWTAFDWVRAVWPVGGFTWGALAYTQHGNHLLLPLASVTGMWGVTFVVLLVNVLAVAALTRIRSTWKPLAGAAVAATAVCLPVLITVPAATGRPLDVAVVQGNVPRELASDRLLQTAVVAENHIALHRQLAGDPPQLAVWPESSLPDDPAAVPALGAAVTDAIRTVGAPTLVGAVAEAPGGRLFNQAILYSGSGQIVGRYSKLHLVPGGEYIPFRAVFGWTDRYRRGNAVLAPGKGIRLFDVDGVDVGTPICFENVFPDLFRRFVAKGANVMILTTNDSSFLDTEASREHVIISQLRAVETGRWVVQAAISGESALIDTSGRVRGRTGLFEQRILRAPIPTSTRQTLYVRWGDWFPLAAAIAALGILVAGMRRRRGSDAAEPDAPPAGERDEASGVRPPAPISGGAEPRALVVLPTFNEAGTIGRVVAGVLEAGPNVDVLVVDDNSPDGTSAVVSDLAETEPRIRLVVRAGKQGLASAYLDGFRMALKDGYDIVVEMDSDMSHLPEELPRLLEGAERFDLTIGSRYVPGGAVSNWSRTRLRISRAGNAYARALLRMPVQDATSGYRAYRRPVLEALISEGIHSEGYAFQIELAYRAWRQGFTVGEVPITFREREQGTSKFSRAIVLEALGKVTQWGLRDRFRRNNRSQAERSGGA